MNEAAPAAGMIEVEVAYALPDLQRVVKLEVPAGTTALDAAQLSGLDRVFGGIDFEQSPMGVFGKAVKPRDFVLRDGDRLEIYRPLKVDPKEVRKKRAAKAKKGA